MKISLNWLNDYVSTNKSSSQLVELFTQLGLECTYTEKSFKLDNIVVGKVLSCIKHPNADRLKICSVDIGSKTLEIVCGAPNIDKDLLVPVAKEGAAFGEFKIKKTTIRDVVSNGMICSGKELGIDDNHEGILILKNNLEIGTSIIDALNLKDDVIFDFDITPNRGDCFSHLGIARELAIIENKRIKPSQIDLKTSNYKIKDLIDVNIIEEEICKRYACRIVKNIKISDSPQWLKNRLFSIGQKSINNIVDLANYVMFDSGQPIHVFDYDKIKCNKIDIRFAKSNETIHCLDHAEKKLDNKDIVIADSKEPIAIAGVIGGLNSHVDKNTKHLLIETAVFDEVSIRKTSKKHNYIKDASKRFERGVDVQNVINVMDKFIYLLLKISNGDVSKDYIDLYDRKDDTNKIVFDLNTCNKFLGVGLLNKDIDKIFHNLNIMFANKRSIYKCIIPSYRNDIKYEVDLFEEVARVYGYNNIPSNTRFTFPVDSLIKDEEILDDRIRSILSNTGFNEHYSNSLYSKRDTKIDPNYIPIKLMNPLNNDMEYLRNSLLPGVLRALSFNEKRGHKIIKLFELGSVNSFNKSKFNKANQYKNLILSWVGNEIKHWDFTKPQNVYTIKGEIEHLFNMLNIKKFNFKIDKNNNLNICISDKIIGYLREVDMNLTEEYDIKSNVFIANINLDLLSQYYNENNIDYHKINSFPPINRDISILINRNVSNQDIEEIIYKNSGSELVELELFDIYNDDKISDDSISMAYSLTFKSNKRTLTDNEVDMHISKIIKGLKNKFDVIQR